VVPAGLGRHINIELPMGAMCEPCNNLLGRQVDEALVHLFEVQLIRGFHRVPDHRGRRIKEIPLRNGVISFPENMPLKVDVFGEGHDEEGEGSVRVKTISKRKQSGDQLRRVARAVMKMGLGLICFGSGHEVALDPDWDPLRAAIGGYPYEGYLLIGEFDILKTPHLTASLSNDLPGMSLAARLAFGGLDLIADLHPQPFNDEVRVWAKEGNYQVMEIAPPTAN
jgi:hypothetical protein